MTPRRLLLDDIEIPDFAYRLTHSRHPVCQRICEFPILENEYGDAYVLLKEDPGRIENPKNLFERYLNVYLDFLFKR